MMGEYVYCIIARKKTPMNFAIKGIGNCDINTIHYKDLTAIVSEAPMREYDPTEENTEKHKQVSLHILEKHTVLPVAFGMVFKTKGVLINTMRKFYPVLKRSLRLIDNKIELGVKAILPKDIKNFESSMGKTKAEFIKECEEEFANALDKIAVKSENGKLFSERLVFNKSFLVERDKIDNFSAELEKLGNKYNSLKMQYTGPWPPYNFVDIRIMGKGR